MPNILVADDDLQLCELLKSVLEEENYTISLAHDGEQALDILGQKSIDLLLLDVMMPKLNGIQTAKQVCKRFATPILMLTAMADESAKIEGFAAGADHYLAKPFSVPELLVRIKAILRRVAMERQRTGTAISDTNLQQAIQALPLTNTEFELIDYLMQHQGRTVSKKDLQIKILRRDYCQFDRNLDMHISNIRRKLTQAGLPKKTIVTVRGKGYAFTQKR
ncbi:DNA-binding response regulator [Thalassotalea euphylliae]|uniref:DNA-binding response regulator n=1 Tax=Thalassotalea euphylliae TaxID=1655234 RepID=A0A3E0TYD5_9GAMM|nr:response regulator transcription factor [Thalassotalea euphylliae]REL28892.1 DNA-binding response regulator [Thalassotalea euphylliae]